MNRRLAGGESSLNVPVGEDGDTTHQDLLPEERPDQEAVYANAEEKGKRWALVEEALETLTPRERHILTERKLADAPKTLEALSGVYGVSRERIRQIEASAFEKVRKAVCAAARKARLSGAAEPEEASLNAAA